MSSITKPNIFMICCVKCDDQLCECVINQILFNGIFEVRCFFPNLYSVCRLDEFRRRRHLSWLMYISKNQCVDSTGSIINFLRMRHYVHLNCFILILNYKHYFSCQINTLTKLYKNYYMHRNNRTIKVSNHTLLVHIHIDKIIKLK